MVAIVVIGVWLRIVGNRLLGRGGSSSSSSFSSARDGNRLLFEWAHKGLQVLSCSVMFVGFGLLAVLRWAVRWVGDFGRFVKKQWASNRSSRGSTASRRGGASAV